MRLELALGTVHVFLSERNLRSLLVKLGGDPPASACTLTYLSQVKFTVDGAPPSFPVQLLVTAEPDGVHYSNPERDSSKPGEMHPATEQAILTSARLALAEAKLKEQEIEWDGRQYSFTGVD
jgi:hypothetical protein